jgi:hypothetical protein
MYFDLTLNELTPMALGLIPTLTLTGAITTNFGMMNVVAKIFNYSKFGVNIFEGFRLAGFVLRAELHVYLAVGDYNGIEVSKSVL